MSISDANNLTRQIIGLAMRVHARLGPGLLFTRLFAIAHR